MKTYKYLKVATEYRLSFAHNYEWTGKENGSICINTLTGRTINQVNVNRCLGYYIKSKFYSLTYLRLKLEKIPKEKCPF